MYHILNAKGPSATAKEIASHFNVIMMAGAVTTATFLSSVLYYLSHNRQALGRLQDEIRSAFPSIEAITSKDLLDCVYLNAVVEEGLRIYPPAGAAHLSRIVPKGGCEISGRFIPEGVSFLSLLHFTFILSLFFSSLSSASVHLSKTTPRLVYPSMTGPSSVTLKTSMHPRNSFLSAGSTPRPRAKKATS